MAIEQVITSGIFKPSDITIYLKTKTKTSKVVKKTLSIPILFYKIILGEVSTSLVLGL